MNVVRCKHMIMTIDVDAETSVLQVFPSINHAKRHNRVKLGGKATVVAKLPKFQKNHKQHNERCDRS